MIPRAASAAGEQRNLALLLAPLTAAALIAQQVASNAVRDALFLTWFQVTTLPYFMAAAAVLAIPAAEFSGRLLARFGPARFVPFILGVSSVLFLVEWSLLGGHPRTVSACSTFTPVCLGRSGISAFWSLLNERFDPHSAKALMARVAAAGAFGGLAGGVGAERVTVLMSQGALFSLLGLSAAACVAGSLFIGRGMAVRGADEPATQKTAGADGPRSGACHCFAISPWSSRLPRRSRHWSTIAQGGSRQLAWQGRAAGSVLRPLLCRDGPRRLPAAGAARTPDPRSDRTWRLGRQPPAAGGRGRPGEPRCPGALARHPATRPRCDAARVNLPGRLRALLHAAARGSQAGGQVGGGRECRLPRERRRRRADRAADPP